LARESDDASEIDVDGTTVHLGPIIRFDEWGHPNQVRTRVEAWWRERMSVRDIGTSTAR